MKDFYRVLRRLPQDEQAEIKTEMKELTDSGMAEQEAARAVVARRAESIEGKVTEIEDIIKGHYVETVKGS